MLRRTNPALIVAIIALVAGVAGTASAAKSLITGAQIKDRSITLRDISPKARKSLIGERGPSGPAGPAGLAGAVGPVGPTGPSDAFATSAANIDIPNAADGSGKPTQTVLSLDVPTGSYVIQAHSFVNNPSSNAQVDCRLEGGSAVDEGRQDVAIGEFANDQQLNHLLTATVTTPATISWKCTDHGAFDVRMFSARLVAIRVGTLTT